MKNAAGFQAIANDLPKGIHRSRSLPDPQLQAQWDSIILDGDLKDRLLSQAVLNFTLRPKVDRSVIPLHGVIFLVGKPGTGKTSLARGLAHRTAQAFPKAGFRLLEVEPHSLSSAAMGKTQKAVTDLFAQSIAEAAQAGPTIVLLDEVETLAADRSRLSFDANPVDVHRATDAVLVQLDALADRFNNLLFLATSNFPEAVDSAFTSRCDLVVHFPMPSREACEAILRDCIAGLAKTYPRLGDLLTSSGFRECVDACVGLDGRAIRKLVANALAATTDTALDPSRVTIADLLAAARYAKANRTQEAKAK